ncbi:InlB B-repeat-containing protein [Enterococcus ureasiticus]|uniref:Gram-positive cocci surface proteins LPxTG domain-containing protein n=1 Tax=Enterococcus ureasiticus TaxID=903984 RepID=A0A1E5G8K5_9ENTE|nr:InlB B-repeat-containing protein [Enterococcus ureasiticus]OEG09022.1 hypothetical protein BCR21_15720 [Enterococcus ureasiticus]
MKNRPKFIAFLFLLVLSLSFAISSFAQNNEKNQNFEMKATKNEQLDRLFRNSYDVFKDLRNDLGVYRDSILLEPGENYHPSSVAATGVGLMSLTIADKKNWEENAVEKARKTVATMTDQTAGFHADRTSNGFYRHFINMETGVQEWNSEYSTIDTAIFLVGAMFAEKYFNDAALSESVAKLYHSIDFEAAIADIDTGGIYLTMNEDGTGGSNSITLPYNEYIIVAWLAYNQNISNPESKAVKFWQNHYATPDKLLNKQFADVSLLTDHPDHYLSSFTLLFPYYMVNMFSESNEYNVYIENGYKADKLWSEGTKKTASYEWGNGPGASPEGYGYHADAINNNELITISPHIIAGFLPVNPSGTQDLLDLYANKKGIYRLQSDSSKEILWRYSVVDPAWKANSIQGIDYSTFIFGLATLDDDIGLTFFQDNNNFFTKVDFDLNGGTGEIPPAQHLTVGDTLQEPTTKPTRPDYTFAGWSRTVDGSAGAWNFSEGMTPTQDLTLYAQWEMDKHTVTFDLNGGTSEVPPIQSVGVGVNIETPTPDPTRLGYTFAGWSTNIAGSEKVWNFSMDVMPDKDLTLYAQWRINTYTVTFDLNGGGSPVPAEQNIAFGSKVMEPTPAPTRSGHTFIGWYDAEDNVWDFRKMSMPDSDIKLYAHWKKLGLDNITTDNGNVLKKENIPTTKSNTLPKTGEKVEFVGICGLLLVSSLVVVIYKKNM